MGESLFVTGASGLIGSRLLAALDPQRVSSLRLLARGPLALPSAWAEADHVELVRGDLLEPAGWAAKLDPETTVVHAAAATGSASAAELAAVNRGGVAALLEACRERGVRRLLHLSTVAAGYPALDEVPYGRSKREAERLIETSDLDYTIVRPSVVVDPASPAFASLVTLATAPALIVPGDGRARLQPIDLEDLVVMLLRILDEARFRREILELGGPEALSCEDFLGRIRTAAGGPAGPVLHLPLGLLLPALRALERLWPGRGAPPVSAGQFAVFRFDGVSGSDEVAAELAPARRDVAAMLQRSLPDAGAVVAERECEVFSRYLLGRPPDAYLRERYLAGVARGELAGAPEPFDRLLLRIARLHPLATRAIDVFARFFCPAARVRKQLILTLAIAESWAPSYRELDRADRSSPAVFVLRAGLQGLLAAALLLPAAFVLLPARLWLGRRPGRD